MKINVLIENISKDSKYLSFMIKVITSDGKENFTRQVMHLNDFESVFRKLANCAIDEIEHQVRKINAN